MRKDYCWIVNITSMRSCASHRLESSYLGIGEPVQLITSASFEALMCAIKYEIDSGSAADSHYFLNMLYDELARRSETEESLDLS